MVCPPAISARTITWAQGRLAYQKATQRADGKPVRVRFHWTGGASSRWEQAMSADGDKSWALNWAMKFQRA